ncbi:MAG: NADH-quinone oxidoreductase subunit N [Candidatus Omnitrophota bacterium]|nr:NADH-quinone oxidoreductase subunit N [Candidatus Omnitrophota bacterium]
MINLALLKIELLVCALMGLIFIVDLCIDKKGILRSIAIAGSLAILVFSFFFKTTGTTFFGAYISDSLSIFFKMLFLLNVFLIIILSQDFLKKNPLDTGEYFMLLLSSTLGMLLMVSSQELMTFYVSLELLSISSYILSGHQKSNPRSTEAGIKYLLLGAMASGILLFGMSLIYGAVGTIHFTEIAVALTVNSSSPILYIGLVFVLVGLSFKIAVVPFHMWVPDVYEGAPTPVVAFFSVGTKMAGFAVLIRLFMIAFGSLKHEWGMLMVVLSAVTIIIGNLLAIPQTNIKRFMGYSSIAQAGYILMGLAMTSFNGLCASLFYLVAYLFSNLCAFAVIIIYSRKTGSNNIEDYRGLARRSPVLAFVLLIALMSLGGVPPLVGFLGKLYLFFAAVENGFTWLVVIGVLMSVVSIYYYLMVLKRVYIDPSDDTSPIPLFSWEKCALTICVAGTVILGFFPYPVFNHILSIVHSFSLQ